MLGTIEFWVGALLGLFIGLLVATILLRYTAKKLKKVMDERTVGELVVDTSDPDGPYLFLELHTTIDRVMKLDEVILGVDTSGLRSQ